MAFFFGGGGFKPSDSLSTSIVSPGTFQEPCQASRNTHKNKRPPQCESLLLSSKMVSHVVSLAIAAFPNDGLVQAKDPNVGLNGTCSIEPVSPSDFLETNHTHLEA